MIIYNTKSNSILEQDSLQIEQEVSDLEALTNIEKANKYEIYSILGNRLGMILETGKGFQKGFIRTLTGSMRGFKMEVLDANEETILYFKRKFAFLFPIINVYGKDNQHLGYVQKEFSLLSRKYSLYNNAKRKLGVASAPTLKWTFTISSPRGSKIGHIKKLWSGLDKEFATTADNFTVEFPKNFTTNEKAIVLATTIMIDFDCFER